MATFCQPKLYHPPQSRLTKPIDKDSYRRAVFLDRDGVIVQDVGYLTDLCQLKLLPGAVKGIRLLQDEFLIVVVTNQSAVARGLLNEEQLLLIHQELAATLCSYSAFLDAVYACPHHPTSGSLPYKMECSCRKPQPGMLLQARDDCGIQPSLSFMIGDKFSDILAGQRAGVAGTILIPSHQTGSKTLSSVKPTFVANNLYQAGRWILNHLKIAP